MKISLSFLYTFLLLLTFAGCKEADSIIDPPAPPLGSAKGIFHVSIDTLSSFRYKFNTVLNHTTDWTNIKGYEWIFEDSIKVSSDTCTRTYSTLGLHKVVVRLLDKKNKVVDSASVNLIPVFKPRLIFDSLGYKEYKFTVECDTLPGFQYLWDFGEGSEFLSSDRTVKHFFNNSKEFIVNVKIISKGLILGRVNTRLLFNPLTVSANQLSQMSQITIKIVSKNIYRNGDVWGVPIPSNEILAWVNKSDPATVHFKWENDSLTSTLKSDYSKNTFDSIRKSWHIDHSFRNTSIYCRLDPEQYSIKNLVVHTKVDFGYEDIPSNHSRTLKSTSEFNLNASSLSVSQVSDSLIEFKVVGSVVRDIVTELNWKSATYSAPEPMATSELLATDWNDKAVTPILTVTFKK